MRPVNLSFPHAITLHLHSLSLQQSVPSPHIVNIADATLSPTQTLGNS